MIFSVAKSSVLKTFPFTTSKIGKKKSLSILGFRNRSFHSSSNKFGSTPSKRWREDPLPASTADKEPSKGLPIGRSSLLHNTGFQEEEETVVSSKREQSHPTSHSHGHRDSKQKIKEEEEQFTSPRITVLGVGGAGGNTLNTLIDSNLHGVEFIAANTDAQALSMSKSHRKIQLGRKVTKGLGAGAKPHVGKEAAKESLDEIMREIDKNHMLFLTAGMGGGTGTGACPIIAEAARAHGILTVALVTLPFHFEGKKRLILAEEGIKELEKAVDCLIIIPNQKLMQLEDKQKHTWQNSFKLVDTALLNGIRTVTDLLFLPGEINVDFADVNTVMKGMGRGLLGTGEAEGHDRAKLAAQNALYNPLLEDVSLKGAKACLINIYRGSDLALTEVDECAGVIQDAIGHDANIIFGSTFDEKLSGRVKVSLIVTGMNKPEGDKPIPITKDAKPPTSTPSKENIPTAKEAVKNAAEKLEQIEKGKSPSGMKDVVNFLKKHW